jgi:hypothetical protein
VGGFEGSILVNLYRALCGREHLHSSRHGKKGYQFFILGNFGLHGYMSDYPAQIHTAEMDSASQYGHARNM